jgi:hypothetical protein
LGRAKEKSVAVVVVAIEGIEGEGGGRRDKRCMHLCFVQSHPFNYF